MGVIQWLLIMFCFLPEQSLCSETCLTFIGFVLAVTKDGGAGIITQVGHCLVNNLYVGSVRGLLPFHADQTEDGWLPSPGHQRS